MAMAVFGTAVNKLLLAFGYHDWAYRNLFVMTASYISFFVLIKIWLHLLSRDVYRLKDTANLKEPKAKRDSSGSIWEFLNFLNPSFSDELATIVAVLVVIFLLVAVGIWIGAEGTTILIDAAFDASLSVSLIGASKNIVSGNWQGGVLKRTIFPFLIMLLISTAIIALLTTECPNATKLSEAMHQCKQPKAP